jgi:protein O-mannosyl-transferase
VLLALATIALYWPAMQHEFVNYDDDHYVTENSRVQAGLNWENFKWALTNPVAENWHPLTVWSHMLVCNFCGVNPWGHHLANVLLHAANAALVLLLLWQMTGALGRTCLVAALFAVHPLHVESVAWVAERKDVLSGFFGLLTLIFYARYAQARSEKQKPTRFFFSSSYWLAVLCFALGLMSKPMLVTWPFVLLLLDFWPLGRVLKFPAPRSNAQKNVFQVIPMWQLVLEKLPFFLLSAMACLITFKVQQHGAAMESVQNLPLGARGENALIAYCRYLEKIFWPVNLSVFYPHPGYWPMAPVVVAGTVLAGLFGMFLALRKNYPFMLMGWLFFAGTLVPVIGLVQVGQQSIADRYTYLPALGIFLLMAWAADELTQRWRNGKIFLTTASAVALIGCAILTRQQLDYWRESESLFRHAIAVTAKNHIAHFNLGVALDAKEQTADAIHEYQESVRIKPDYARAYINLGADLAKFNQLDEAVKQYREAIRLTPASVSAHNDLGVALFNQGHNDEAIQEYQQVIRLDTNNAFARNNFGAALYIKGQHGEAIHQLQEAVRIEPNYGQARFNLANVFAQEGQTNNAVREFQELLRRQPDYPEASARLAQLSPANGK